MPKTLTNIKDDILLIARQLLSEEGYERLNVRTIASKCGIATGTFYNYYRSKQEIVEEIMKTEWNMMLRRIEQGSKGDLNLIDKLGIVYNELHNLMNNIHNVWFDSQSLKVDTEEFSRIKHQKQALSNVLADKILSLIGIENGNRDNEFLADVICKLFILYAYDGNVEYKKLAPVVTSMLRQ